MPADETDPSAFEMCAPARATGLANPAGSGLRRARYVRDRTVNDGFWRYPTVNRRPAIAIFPTSTYSSARFPSTGGASGKQFSPSCPSEVLSIPANSGYPSGSRGKGDGETLHERMP